MEGESVNRPEGDSITTPSQSSAPTVRGLIDVVISPETFFGQLKERPTFWLPWVLYIAAGLLSAWLLLDLLWTLVFANPDYQKQLESQPGMASFLKGALVAQGGVQTLIDPVIAAVLAKFWGEMVFGGRASFRALMGVTCYGSVIAILGMIIYVLMALTKQSLTVGVNLGVLAPVKDLNNPVYIALSKIDLFLIWQVIVVGIGLSIVYGFDRNKGYAMSVLSVGMLSILHVLLTAIF